MWSDRSPSRRGFLQSCVAATATAASSVTASAIDGSTGSAGDGSGSVDAAESGPASDGSGPASDGSGLEIDEPDVTIDRGASDAETLVIESVSSDRYSSLLVTDQTGEQIGGTGLHVEEGVTKRDVSVPLDPPLERSQVVVATLYESGGPPIARDSAVVPVDGRTARPAQRVALSVSDQQTDGESVVIDEVRTDVDASLFVHRTADDATLGDGARFSAGAVVEDLTVDLDPTLGQTEQVVVTLARSNGPRIAVDGALLTVDGGDGRRGPSASVRVADQSSDGGSIAIESVRTDVDASLFLRDSIGRRVGGTGVRFEAGASRTGFEVDLGPGIHQSRTVSATLYESGGGPIAADAAYVTVDPESGPPTCHGDPAADLVRVDDETVCDLDGEGRYRDVNGDGTLGNADVVTLFEHLDDRRWQSPTFFDVSGNGVVGRGDVLALFEDVATTA